ncbi:MAG TPA: GGDEF domain-containing protein [Solirubrobacteraceae bacterium]|nr:GGDEF domain-containing protein [Solirubrobacteraceae bacterium]
MPAQHPRLRGQAKPDRAQRRLAVLAARRSAVLTLASAAATAAVVALAGGGDAFWAAVPAVLLAAGANRGRVAGLLGGALVIGAAIVAERSATHGARDPGLWLLVLVPAASVAVLLAVRERLEHERDALRASALSDPLTGLANRRALLARIEYEIARHARSRRTFAVLMLDLDGFKLLNDRFGHAAGDDLLREVAGALARVVRDQDTVARVGGDEFCVLAPETDESGSRRLVARVETAVGHAVAGLDALGAGVGAALFPHDGRTADEVLGAADQRLLSAKRQAAQRASRRRRAA